MGSILYSADAIFDDPVQQLAREAYRIVMNYPHQGKLDDKHVLALRSIELKIISEPNGIEFNDKFRVKLQSALPAELLVPTALIQPKAIYYATACPNSSGYMPDIPVQN